MKNRLKKKIAILVFLLIAPQPIFAATPTITNVSGTVASGQILTISGTNMVNELNTNWDGLFKGKAYGFEGSSVTSDGYAMGGGNAYDPVYSTAVKMAGSKSLKSHAQGAWDGPSGPASMVYFSPENGGTEQGDIWIRFYGRWDINGGSFPAIYQKLIDSQGSGGQYYLDLVGDEYLGAWQTSQGNQSFYFSDPYGGISSGRWYCYELHWRASSPKSYTAFIDGNQVLTGSSMVSADLSYILFGIINYSGTSSVFNEDAYYDNLTVSSSRVYPSAIIEVSGDGITWKYQEPVYLSDTSTQFKLNLNGLNGTNYRLRVTNNQQQTSSVYSLSGGADTVAPQNPVGLSVM